MNTFAAARVMAVFPNVELGNRIPSVEFVLQIAEHFDVSLDDLMRDERELRLKKR